jgi:hypothetical protein
MFVLAVFMAGKYLRILRSSLVREAVALASRISYYSLTMVHRNKAKLPIKPWYGSTISSNFLLPMGFQKWIGVQMLGKTGTERFGGVMGRERAGLKKTLRLHH